MMRRNAWFAFAGMCVALPAQAENVLTLGAMELDPGMQAEFKAESPDKIVPEKASLAPKQADIYLAAVIRTQAGHPLGANNFIPNLNVMVKITDEITGKNQEYKLIPHVSAQDGLHYARNIKLPGIIQDNYALTFTILPPKEGEFNFRSDWVAAYGAQLLPEHKVEDKPVLRSATFKAKNFSGISPHML